MNFTELQPGVEVDPFLTLRAAAERIEGYGGKVERSRFGLKITIPQSASPPRSRSTPPGSSTTSGRRRHSRP
jgi:hypothetical protein